MNDVSHTHPHDAQGAGPVFRRGPRVAADGGEREAVPEDDEDGPGGDRESATRPVDEDGTPMEDVDHTPPHDEEGANRVFARGGEEVREESVDDE